jgi:hypothetical protein
LIVALVGWSLLEAVILSMLRLGDRSADSAL